MICSHRYLFTQLSSQSISGRHYNRANSTCLGNSSSKATKLSYKRCHLTACVARIQDDYAKEFVAFKPDKRLRWLPHLGTIHLEIELQDRTVPADVPPLEAAFIELFSERGKYEGISIFHCLVCLANGSRHRFVDCGRANRSGRVC